MGYRIKQQTLSGLEATGGHNLVVVEVDAVADFASYLPTRTGASGTSGATLTRCTSRIPPGN